MGPEMVLEEVGVPYQLVPVNTRENESRTTANLKINPAGQVPCLIYPDGRKMTESAAIMLTFRTYCDTHPFASQWCDNRMPDLLRWLFFLSGSMTRGYSLLGRPDKFAGESECRSDIANRARDYLDGLWNLVEASIEGEFFFRDGYSVIDTYIVMQLLWDAERDLLFSSRRRLNRLFETVVSRSAIAKVINRHSDHAAWQYDNVDLPELARQLSI